METLLRQGTTLIVDRYSFSGVAFTHAKLNPSLTLEWCINPDIGLLSPDLVLFLNVSPQAAQTRAGFGQERYESADMQQRVRTAFEKVADHVKGIDWIQIDADQSMDQVGLDIQTHVAKVLQQVKADGKDIKWDLWSSSTSENV